MDVVVSLIEGLIQVFNWLLDALTRERVLILLAILAVLVAWNFRKGLTGGLRRRPKVEADRSNFSKADGYMTEVQLGRLLNGLAAEQAFWTVDKTPAVQFCQYFINGPHPFNSPVIQPLARNLVRDLTRLLAFLDQNFEQYPHTQYGESRQYCLRPDLDERRSARYEASDPAAFIELSTQLSTLVEAARRSYAEYRAAVKRTLVI